MEFAVSEVSGVVFGAADSIVIYDASSHHDLSSYQCLHIHEVWMALSKFVKNDNFISRRVRKPKHTKYTDARTVSPFTILGHICH